MASSRAGQGLAISFRSVAGRGRVTQTILSPAFAIFQGSLPVSGDQLNDSLIQDLVFSLASCVGLHFSWPPCTNPCGMMHLLVGIIPHNFREDSSLNNPFTQDIELLAIIPTVRTSFHCLCDVYHTHTHTFIRYQAKIRLF